MLRFNSMGFEVRQLLKRFNQFRHESAQNQWSGGILNHPFRAKNGTVSSVTNFEPRNLHTKLVSDRSWSFVQITRATTLHRLSLMSHTSAILLIQGTGNTTDLRFCLWTTTRRSFTGLHHHNNFAPLASTKKKLTHKSNTIERPTTTQSLPVFSSKRKLHNKQAKRTPAPNTSRLLRKHSLTLFHSTQQQKSSIFEQKKTQKNRNNTNGNWWTIISLGLGPTVQHERLYDWIHIRHAPHHCSQHASNTGEEWNILRRYSWWW